ncbi:MAG: carboxypeptidase-like regulatory domain-containing protein [Candidatus Poribacteria bacterium]|nr:carboxypeptidase-like regulatory domain-containing protein [Candidatus Poribacteria bacterium]
MNDYRKVSGISQYKMKFCFFPILFYFLLFLLSFGFSIGICQSQGGFHAQLGTIHGQVTDKQNNPLTGYIISAVSQTDKVHYTVKTNSGGQFTLKSLAAGTWVVKVRYLSTLLAQREATVTEETEVTANFVIEGTGVVSGFLLDSISELPLPITDGIQIGLLTQDEKRVDRIYNGEVSNGYFEAKNLLPGRYRIIDSFDGYVFAIMRNALGAFRPPMMTVYPDSHVGGVKVFLKPGASLSGRFIDAENRQPISGVTVRAASEVKDTVYPESTFAHQTETNTNGEFHLTVPNDSDTYYAFTIIALHPQYQTHHWRWDMFPDKNVYDLGELSLKNFLSLQGKVTASNSGYTVDGLKVQLKMHNKSADFFRAAAQPEHIVQTDADGNFLFSELHPIEYSLTISRNGVMIAFLEAVNPQSKKPLKIRLPKMQRLHGTVVDENQNPIADTNLYAARRSETPHGHGALLAMTQTDANGAFQMQLLETKPHLLSVEVSKKGYLSRIYPNVKIGKESLIVPLQEGFSIKGRVILPRDVPIDGFYEVKVFPENAKMASTLNPLTLNRPLLSKRFPITETTFVLDGLFEEKYKLYIMGTGITATEMNVKASTDSEEVLIVADKPTLGIKGQVLWEATGEPVQNALVSRSWYPWELSQYDMSLTLDRFETETDAQGRFSFSNLTQERYNLRIRAVQSVFEKEAKTYRRVYIQKQVAIPICSDDAHHIYLGKADGTPFAK